MIESKDRSHVDPDIRGKLQASVGNYIVLYSISGNPLLDHGEAHLVDVV